jgi:ATP-binding cassette subfamily B protein RaxB
MKIGALNFSNASRLPVIRQNEAAECGLASLAMVAGYYGFETDLSTLRRRYNTNLQGMTLKDVIGIAKQMGFATRPIKVNLGLINKIKLPAIIHWDLNHFVVLKSVSKNKIILHDPALGERYYTEDEFSSHFTGVALELTPTHSFEARKEKTTLRLSDLWDRMHGMRRNLVLIFSLSIILQLFVLVSPFYLQLAVDEVLTKFDTQLLLVLALGFAGLAVINFITQALRGYVLLYFGSMLSFQMVGNLFRHLIKLPVSFFEKRHIGDIVSRFGSMEPIKVMLTEGLISSLIDGLMALTTLTLMFIYSPKLAFIAFGAWLLYFVIRMAFFKQFRIAQEEAIISRAKENTLFIETVRGITSLKLFGGEGDREIIWQNKFADVINTKVRVEKIRIWFQSANVGIFGLETVVLIYVAINMVLTGGFSLGMFFAFMAYKLNFTTNASAFVEKAIEFRLLNLHLERISDIVFAEQEEQNEDLPSYINRGKICGEISLVDIAYRYSDTSTDVIKNINMTISLGQSVVITGKSGCGKTTLLKIMTGLFKPSSGKLLVDGMPLDEYGVKCFREQIGVVMQDDDLFAGSISENIGFFDTDLDMSRVISASKSAMIHDEIMAMPMKYESLVGDMGSSLSGGQKQRIMLARALYRKPKILFMDEGTAHLDVDTESQLNHSLSKLGVTLITIAHRPETIRMAEQVMVIRDGTLSELEKV